MPSPYDQQIEDLLEQYRRQREQAAETRRRINATTSTATAPRQTVKVTVGAQGEVTAIEFPTGAYRRMAPKELADVLLATIQQARSEALDGVAGVLAGELPSGVTVADLLQGRVDPTALLPEDPAMPDSVRDYVDHGFQGESHE
ncbi:YbaB/EbfC family nucleoid-associated protein [Streptomyces sp. NPDC060011]|uniref:YbaB/EbfC family nucleoid-associated protein n=1 Tax=unclassified Streptomyces TaxID=2593676 RepID=UPI0013BB1BF2|nr:MULTISPECIES: YbaB/EbfC family nucleoid-associated protein [unclassified Streptomyces]MCX5135012.1 YbaB/EbfC family nucleoid-associated protein [Streptomyces sp. NBC_00340]MCX5280872.1 YbaB/EbfC family nucleoid-associated protein [Streptomyces sp. NBC_00198]NEB27674.1 YbaB/EbfC family nucleoid-associated protein [Streptomyces sp. SID14446]WSD75952.1 YbaB/EbfC family nucleoid-associated protein [Streptomyces sp. NBC_01558]